MKVGTSIEWPFLFPFVLSIDYVLMLAAGFQGYYETSALTGENVYALFEDVVRQVRFPDAFTKQRERASAHKKLAKSSGLPALMPWNWGKKAKCVCFNSVHISPLSLSLRLVTILTQRFCVQVERRA